MKFVAAIWMGDGAGWVVLIQISACIPWTVNQVELSICMNWTPV